MTSTSVISGGRPFDTLAFSEDKKTHGPNTITADEITPPTGPALAVLSSSSLKATWTASTKVFATHYDVDLRPDPGAYGGAGSQSVTVDETTATCANPPGGDTGCETTFTGLTSGTTYCVRVRANLKISGVTRWTSAFTSPDVCATPFTLVILKLNSPLNTSTNTLTTGSASGRRDIEASNQQPFPFVTWSSDTSVTVRASASWTLHLKLDSSPPFQSASLQASLKLVTGTDCTAAGTALAASAVTTILPANGTTEVDITLTPPGVVGTPISGTLCLTITNVTPNVGNNGTAHRARVLTDGGSTLTGPVSQP